MRHILKASSFGEKRLQALEKIGFFKGDKNSNKSIWIHAVSVGEVNVALKLIQDLEGILENPNFILSTTTLTGARKAKENAKEKPKIREVGKFGEDGWSISIGDIDDKDTKN